MQFQIDRIIVWPKDDSLRRNEVLFLARISWLWASIILLREVWQRLLLQLPMQMQRSSVQKLTPSPREYLMDGMVVS